MSTKWGSFPKAAVDSGKLASLTGANGEVGAHIAAHKVYLALALHVNFHTRQVEMGMSFLQERTALARPMLSRALSALEQAGVLQVERDGYRNRYTQLLHEPNAFRQVPRVVTSQALKFKFNRGVTVLAAWKLLLVLLFLRDGKTGESLATHDTLQRYSRVRPEHVSAGISQLVEWGLVRHRPTESNRNGHPSFVYRLMGDFGGGAIEGGNPVIPVLKPSTVPF
ncbi:helix-turn-helix domain-containing protein [Stenotrophomonas sp. ESTM1D_MKCIP4_1]|uniref:helix-turn-helix domain-containing protein n=1 Tax=Stenotrophomonas sp. ESTM1D_MKCIP4_1 TaxID=2072414 RepID=UPI0020B15339|nr:helix-turn-helix domain-containing protein [Stenotrophomonas sp. ESTM1D_MKCIP4_1]